MRRATFPIALLVCLIAVAPALAQDQAAAWAALKQGGVVALIRHTDAPMTKEVYDNVRIDDCSTQRLLSDKGKAEARALGERWRRERVPVGRVLSSRWCRCLDTARLAFGEAIEPFEALNSIHSRADRAAAQTATVRDLVVAQAGRPDVVAMVTHWQNIEALVGLKPDQGETVVVRAGAGGRIEVVGVLPVPATM